MSHLIVPTVSVRLQVIGDALHRLIQFFEQSVGGADPNYEPVTGILADLSKPPCHAGRHRRQNRPASAQRRCQGFALAGRGNRSFHGQSKVWCFRSGLR